jgi:CubicO group peptidase (beta-lactamase class C family)
VEAESQPVGGVPAAVRAAAEELVAAGHVPGVVVAVARPGALPAAIAHGVDGTGAALEADTLFPVASITKLATALAALRLVDQGGAALDDELGRHLGGAPGVHAARPEVTLRSLLCHTAGLPLDVPAQPARYEAGLDWARLADACLQTPLEAEPWTRVQYSNVGYGLLALVVERLTGKGFAEALGELVLAPLGVEGYLGQEPPRPPVTLADVRGEHSGTELEPFNSRFWRSLALPWAGLVTTAAGALALVRAFLPGSELLSDELRAAAVGDQTRGLAGGFVPPLRWAPCPWGLGPDLRGQKKPHWVPQDIAPESFGHSGASGALAWADPASGAAWAILGARTADGGWLLRRSGGVSQAVVAEGQGQREGQ